MLLNRYYSTHDRLQIKLRYLSDFRNWKLTDYIENTTQTLLADNSGNTSFNDTISKGDARLYSVLEVVKHGGNLIADENVGEGMTLTGDMTRIQLPVTIVLLEQRPILLLQSYNMY